MFLSFFGLIKMSNLSIEKNKSSIVKSLKLKEREKIFYFLIHKIHLLRIWAYQQVSRNQLFAQEHENT